MNDAETIQQLCLIVKLLTDCPTCEGTGKWQPECEACLVGAPTRCMCEFMPFEKCPQCCGEGRYWSDEQAKKLWRAIYPLNVISFKL